MERRYQARLDELLGDAEVRPGLLRGLLPRLETFLEPFVRPLCCCEQRTEVSRKRASSCHHGDCGQSEKEVRQDRQPLPQPMTWHCDQWLPS